MIQMDQPIAVSFFDNVHDNVPKTLALTFGEFVEIMEHASHQRQPRDAKEMVMSVVPAQFDPPKRSKFNVTERYCFTGDVDGDKSGDPGFDGMVVLWTPAVSLRLSQRSIRPL